MAWQDYYQPPQSSHWQGRSDAPKNSAIFQIVQFIYLLDDSIKLDHLVKNSHSQSKKTHSQSEQINPNQKNTFALLGFCCDEGVRRNFGRTGAAEGPDAFRKSFAKLPVHDPTLTFYDAGDVMCNNGNLEDAQNALAQIVSQLLSHNITPIVIGGGHEVAWGHYQGIEQEIGDTKLGIVNFDAHFDMRQLIDGKLGSSGTPFLQIAYSFEHHKKPFDYNCIGIQKTANINELFQTAQNQNVHTILAEDLHQGNPKIFFHFIDKIIERCGKIYVSICLDVFAAAFAPGVSAVQPLGISPWHMIPLLRRLVNSGKVISYDIVELNPKYDINEQTAKLAANLVHEIIQK